MEELLIPKLAQVAALDCLDAYRWTSDIKNESRLTHIRYHLGGSFVNGEIVQLEYASNHVATFQSKRLEDGTHSCISLLCDRKGKQIAAAEYSNSVLTYSNTWNKKAEKFMRHMKTLRTTLHMYDQIQSLVPGTLQVSKRFGALLSAGNIAELTTGPLYKKDKDDFCKKRVFDKDLKPKVEFNPEHQQYYREIRYCELSEFKELFEHPETEDFEDH